MKKLRSALIASALWLGLSAAGVLAYVTDASIHPPTNYYGFMPPAAGGSYSDPVYGTSVKRISDAKNRHDNSNGAASLSFISNEYSTMSPFNKDNSRLILQHASYFALYDGNGNYLWDLPFAVYASSEPRWSKSDPDVLYFVNNNQLKRLDVAANTITVVRTFTEYTSITGKGESDISEDGDHFVFAGNNRYIFVYEISTNTKGPVLDAGSHAFDSLYMTPNDNVTVTWIQAGSARFNGIEFFDTNMNFQRQVTRAGGHMDVARDTDGSEVLVWINSADPTPICNNGIVKVKLANGQQTCLATFDWSQAVHVSAPDNNGWFFMETYVPADPTPTSGWTPYANEILQIRMNGTEKRRLVHHRSRPFDSYYYTPRASVSHDGTKLLFSSNYALQATLGYANGYTDTYLVNVPGAGPSPSPTPSPTPTPGPTPTPAPTPTPTPAPSPTPGAGVIRYEQNSAAVAGSGTWFPNSLASHSGGSASMSVDAGSRLTLSFTGTSVSWVGYRDQWSGIAKVYVDGALKATVDTYAASGQSQSVLYTKSGLTAGAHTLAIEATGTKRAAAGGSWVWIDAFDVTVAGGSPTAWTRLEQSAPANALTGSWSANTMPALSGGSAVISMTAGDKAKLTFNGTGVRWIGFRDPSCGKAKVLIDGVTLATVDTYAAGNQAQVLQFEKKGLSAGSHVLTIKVLGTKNAQSGGSWVNVDAFEVKS